MSRRFLVTYIALCWAFDISKTRRRLKQGVALFRTKLAKTNIG